MAIHYKLGGFANYVLRQSYNFAATGYFWVDAIRIDQTNTEERNRQVAMMGQIYKDAKEVLVGVGPPAADMTTIMGFVRRHGWLLKRFSEYEAYHPGLYFLKNTPLKDNKRLDLVSKCVLRPSEIGKLLDAYRTFPQRPYFSRLWVLQELHSASRAWLCCGKVVESFVTLRTIDILLQFWAREWKRYFRRTINNRVWRLIEETEEQDYWP
jgi:hypothetical protein